MRFKIDWGSIIVGSKLTVFALFYFVFEGNFPGTFSPRGLYLEGRFSGGFLRYEFGGLIFGGGLYMEGLIFGSLRYLLSRFDFQCESSGITKMRKLRHTKN